MRAADRQAGKEEQIMNRALGVGTAVFVCVVSLWTSGCTDKQKERIKLLEEENAKLTNDLASAQEERDAALRDADELKQANLKLRKELEDAKAKLAKGVGEGWRPVPFGAMTSVSEAVLFEFRKAELSPRGRAVLDRIVQEIRTRFPNRDIFIVGHTDNVPIKRPETKAKHPDNWYLSAHRAINVAKYLIAKGISPKRITVAGCGEYRPRVPNTTAANRAKNRRVEIYAMSGGGGAPGS